jgi:hypothetical protein
MLGRPAEVADDQRQDRLDARQALRHGVALAIVGLAGGHCLWHPGILMPI